jgi:hypothetical protein
VGFCEVQPPVGRASLPARSLRGPTAWCGANPVRMRVFGPRFFGCGPKNGRTIVQPRALKTPTANYRNR